MIISRFAQFLKETEVNLPNKSGFSQQNILNGLQIVFGVAGAIAFIIITFSGIKFVLSQGNPQEVAKAKNTIIDALIGLLISLAAFSIVGFFIGRVG